MVKQMDIFLVVDKERDAPIPSPAFDPSGFSFDDCGVFETPEFW